MEKKAGQKGAVMVEASIYVPLVICVVIMLIYYGLFIMQQYMLMYEANRVAIVIAREEAYLGYDKFGMGADNQIDFEWGDGKFPSGAQVKAYYNEYSNKVSHIYREIGGVISAIGGGPEAASAGRMAGAGRESVLLAIGTVSDADIKIDRGIFGTKVIVSFTHALPTPGVLEYLGLGEQMQIRSSAYSYSVNGSSMVRNVDFAVDLVNYILDKFHVGDKVDDFVGKMNKVLDKIL